VRDHEPARRGLADVALQRGSAHEADGLLGVALLWYEEAVRLFNDERYRETVATTRAAMREQIAFRLAVRVNPGTPVSGGDAAEVERRLAAEMGRLRPGFVELAVGRAADDPADFRANVVLDALDVQTRLSRAETKHHAFAESYEVANPEVPRLRASIRDAQLRTRDLESRYLSFQRELDRLSPEDPRYRNVRRRRDNAREAWRSSQRDVERLHHELSRTPHTILRTRQVYWPYTERTFEKVGRITATARMTNGDGRAAVASFGVNRSAVDRDTQIDNANPAIGLQPKSAVLVSDEQMRDDLLAQLTGETAPRFIDAAVRKRADAFIESAEAHRKADRALFAYDALVYAAVTIEPIDAGRAAADLQRLLRELKSAMAAAARDRT
jgi:hypothetical protein